MKKVIATKTGFYETIREVGDVFYVPKDLEASWFDVAQEDIDAPKPKVKKDDDKPA